VAPEEVPDFNNGFFMNRGRQFNNALSINGHVDLLIGGRYTYIESKFDATSGATFKSEKDYFDPMLIMRPWFPITNKLVFNPTLAIGGGGDSDLVYELQPQLHRYGSHECRLSSLVL